MLSKKDHINHLGFKNDGYDYTQHLKEIGGGVFIDRSGAQLPSSSLLGKIVEEKEFELPDDLFSSGVELDRDYEAITISHDLMDEDIRAALFDDCDENGEKFEELQDDFIVEAMADNGDKDFDFDAHIARLIARSENLIEPAKKRNAHFADDVDEEFYLEEGEEVEEDEDADNNSKDGSAVAPISQGDRDFLEKQFAQTIAEYDDSDIGYLSDAESEVDGIIDLDGQDALLEAALDSFLRDQEESAGLERTVHKREEGASTSADSSSSSSSTVSDEGAVDFHSEYMAQKALQMDAADVIHSLTSQPADKAVEVCQEYLREVKLESEWDCETVLSTYSLLENHPTLITDPLSKGGSRRRGSASAQSLSSGVESVSASLSRFKAPMTRRLFSSLIFLVIFIVNKNMKAVLRRLLHPS